MTALRYILALALIVQLGAHYYCCSLVEQCDGEAEHASCCAASACAPERVAVVSCCVSHPSPAMPVDGDDCPCCKKAKLGQRKATDALPVQPQDDVLKALATPALAPAFEQPTPLNRFDLGSFRPTRPPGSLPTSRRLAMSCVWLT